MSDQSSNPGQMSNPATRMKGDPLLAEGMGEEESLGADAGEGNAGQPTVPESPLVPEYADVDDWDGMSLDGAPDEPRVETSPDEVELVSLDTLAQSDAANDNWDDNDDNAYNDPDDALPSDSEESAVKQDLLDTTERGRFGDNDAGPNMRNEDDEEDVV